MRTHDDTLAVYGKCDTVFSENKNSTYKETIGDYFHQALTNFSFSEFIFSDFRYSEFLNVLKENNVKKVREFIVMKI
jgi:hypothetical protein